MGRQDAINSEQFQVSGQSTSKVMESSQLMKGTEKLGSSAASGTPGGITEHPPSFSQSPKPLSWTHLLISSLFPIYHQVNPACGSLAFPVCFKRTIVESSWVCWTVSTENWCFSGLPSNSQTASDHYCSSFEAEYFLSPTCHVLLFLAYLAIPKVFVSSSTNSFITASVGLGLSSGKTMTVILLFMNALHR